MGQKKVRDKATVVFEINSIKCTICKDRYEFRMPIPVDRFIYVAETFYDLHKDCDKNEYT